MKTDGRTGLPVSAGRAPNYNENLVSSVDRCVDPVVTEGGLVIWPEFRWRKGRGQGLCSSSGVSKCIAVDVRHALSQDIDGVEPLEPCNDVQSIFNFR